MQNVEQLKALMEEMSPMTKKEFLKYYEMMVKAIEKMRSVLLKSNQTLSAKLETDNKTNLTKLNQSVGFEMTKLKSDYNKILADLKTKMASIKDGRNGTDGRDADETKIVEEVLSKINLPEIPNISEDLPKLGTEIRNALELLQDDERLDKSAIKGLEEALEEIEKRNLGGGGGGFSKIHLESKMIDDETPSGAINGVNKAFTLISAPNPTASLKVYVNGMKMTITEDYTLSGNTITFGTAPPSGSVIRVDYRK